MAQEKNPFECQLKIGRVYFILFAILIFAGIWVKRVLGHPEFMMMFHLPAAVFLVLAGKNITAKLKHQYNKQSSGNKI